MSHYRLNDVEPSAIVTVNGSEKKIYDNNQIFLNPNDNFEFRFFNPLQEKIGIEINFNGQKKGNSLLVLNPGEDITLDRFLDDKKKMKYSTYFINGKNEQAVKATENNGLVTINFFKEKLWNNQTWITTTAIFNNTRSSNGFYGGNQMYSEYISENTENPIEYSDYLGDTSNSNITLDSMVVRSTYTANLSDDLKSFSPENKNSRVYTNEKLETGRVEKGEESKQDFESVDTKFETTAFHTINYTLKPESTKEKNVGEIRNYCTDCGYRIRKNTWSFCPKCGEEL